MTRRPLAASCRTLVAWLLFVCLAATSAAASTLPERLSDTAFWQMVSEFSEPDGDFHSDNFTSNEQTLQSVIPDLSARLSTGDVYLGVGPEQNFTYIVALQPKMAFIVDIRRQNMLEHLLYKALIELSADRVEFLSRLFSRPRPLELEPNPSAKALFAAYRTRPASRELFQQNLQAVIQRLRDDHGFRLLDEDPKRIEYVYSQFFKYGPSLAYSFPGASARVLEFFPSYADLMTATDGRGEFRSYVGSEDNYQTLRQLHLNNLIVPLVGDFAGPKTLRAVGRYLKDAGATVTAFYTSNVEQYLFEQEAIWRRFYANVATLPLDARSVIVRSVATMGTGRLSEPQLCPIADLIAAVAGGKLTGYGDAVALGKP